MGGASIALSERTARPRVLAGRERRAAASCSAAPPLALGVSAASVFSACSDTTVPGGQEPAPRPRRPAAGPARQPGAAADLSRQPAHPLRPGTRGGPAAALQLGRIRQPRGHQVVRKEIRGRGRAEHLRAPSTKRSPSSPPAPSATTSSSPPSPTSRCWSPARSSSRSTSATSPTCAAQRLEARCSSPWYDVGSRYTVPYTIFSTGIAWRNDFLPDYDPLEARQPLRELLAGERHLRQGRDARRPARRARDGAAAQRDHRRQHRQPGPGRRRPRRAQGTDRPGQPALLHQRLPAHRRRLDLAAPGLVGRHDRDRLLPAEGHAGQRGQLLVAPGRPRPDGQRHDAPSSTGRRTRSSPTSSSTTCSTSKRRSSTWNSPATSSR